MSSVEGGSDNGLPRNQRVAADQPWLDGTELCAQVDGDLFFSSDEADPVLSPMAMFFAARRICDRCPLEDLCAIHAVEKGEVGVWGGTSQLWRARLRARVSDPAARRAAVEERTADNPWVQARRRAEADQAAAS